MTPTRRGLFIIILVLCFVVTAVSAQDATPAEPPTVTPIPTDIPTAIPTETPIPTLEPSLTQLPAPTVTDLPLPTDIPSPTSTATATDILLTEVSPTLGATASASLTASMTATGVTPTSSLTPSATASAVIQNQVGVVAPLANPIACNPSAAMSIASVSSSGVQGDADSLSSAISGDGRYVVFASNANNLVPNDQYGQQDIFRFDRLTCTTVRVSEAPDGTSANGNSDYPTISSDGRYIAFSSNAFNLMSGPIQVEPAIYVRDMQMSTMRRFASSSIINVYPQISDDGAYLLYGSTVYDLSTNQQVSVLTLGLNATLSGNRRYIAFYSNLNLVSDDTKNNYDLYVYDIQNQHYDRITPDGAAAFSSRLSISNDGRYVAFISPENNLVPNDTNGTWDVFVHDRVIGQTIRVSIASDGTQANGSSQSATISGDGRYVVFTSKANNLVAGDGDDLYDVFVHDIPNAQTYKISVGLNGTLADGDSSGYYASISDDGSYITFTSYAKNLIEGDINGSNDVFVAQLAAYAPPPPENPLPTATITPLPPATLGAPVGNFTCNPSASMSMVSVNANGTQANASSIFSYISSTDRYIAYESLASNLVSDDTNGRYDVFVFDRQTCQTVRASTAADGTQGNDNSRFPSISADGRYVGFMSIATNLSIGDSDSLWDIYVKDLLTGNVTRIPMGILNSNISDSPPGKLFFAADEHTLVFFTPGVMSANSLSMYDLQTQQKSLLVSSVDMSVNRNSVSANLRYVVFSTNDPNHELGNPTFMSQVFLLDRQTNQITLVSVSSAGAVANWNSYDASISADGRYVVFTSEAKNLEPNHTYIGRDVYVRDLQNNVTSRVSAADTNTAETNGSWFGSISDDGRYVAFLSNSNQLVNDDKNNSTDVFVRDRITNRTYLISASINGGTSQNAAGGIITNYPYISRDGAYVTFSSASSDLIAGDTNNINDIFVAKRESFVPGNDLVVNTSINTNDGTCNATHCSLIEAVNASNAIYGVQTIKFNIPGTGVHTIKLSSSLEITSSVIIDGATQPGYSGSPFIEIVPVSSTVPANAIVINGATPTTYDPNTTVTIRGLIINSFAGFAIQVSNGQAHLIEKNYIGTDATGTVAKGNDTGIIMTAPNSTIRNNVISGNRNTGLYLYSNGGRKSTDNAISDNYIGTNVEGIEAIPNQIGIRLAEGASNNNIGRGNVISGNNDVGILVGDATTSGNIIRDNFIGISADGSYLLGNGGIGIFVASAVNTIIGGGSSTFDGNEIWGNLVGISVSNGANNTTIQGNTIVQNGPQGIVVSANNTIIMDNTVSLHTSRGIVISGGTGNRISSNRLSDNGGMGIDLGNNGLTPNDVGDADTGANNLQNFPIITSAVNSGSNTTVNGTLNSRPNQYYHLEFFRNEMCSVSSYGEGAYGAGSTDVTTDAGGNASFTAQINNFTMIDDFGYGWTGTFFPSNNLTGTGVPVSSIQGGLNFNWGTGVPIVNGTGVAGMPADNFSARFTSSQNFTAGLYTFIVSADDGVRVYIDGSVVLDKFVGRPLTTDQFTVNLSTGYHTLTVEYFEATDQATLQVRWHLNGFVTSTATDANGNTSEFSACVPIPYEATPATSPIGAAPPINYSTTNTRLLTWNRVSWAVGYKIQISLSNSFSVLQCGGTQQTAAEVLSLTTCPLASGTYYWRAQAVAATGTSGWSLPDTFVIAGP